MSKVSALTRNVKNALEATHYTTVRATEYTQSCLITCESEEQAIDVITALTQAGISTNPAKYFDYRKFWMMPDFGMGGYSSVAFFSLHGIGSLIMTGISMLLVNTAVHKAIKS